MNADFFIQELCSMDFENAFNPYSQRCDIYDLFDAPKKRKRLLKNILAAAADIEIDSIWVGRDLGYRGGRRTGLALTDDVHLKLHAKRWGEEVEKITKGQVVPERTAAIIWDILSKIYQPVFLWNVFPLHPFESGNPFTNRAHNSKERDAGEELLFMLIQSLKPKKVIAIGNDAERSVTRVAGSVNVYKVRHPSYGGQNEFLSQMGGIYEINYLGKYR